MAIDGSSSEKLRDFWNGDHWDFDDLMPTIGHELVQFSLECAPMSTDSEDILFWKLSSSGMFAVNSAWDSVRKRVCRHRMDCMVWSSPLPTQSKLLVWRLLKAILPVDLVVKKQGVCLASRCFCCEAPGEESLVHLFIHSDLASCLWDYFGAVFAVRDQPTHSLLALLTWWFHSCRGSSHFATQGRMAAIAICQ